jgi:hypothetical protein
MFDSMTLRKPIKVKCEETWDVLKLVNYVEKLAESDNPIDVRDTRIYSYASTISEEVETAITSFSVKLIKKLAPSYSC